MPSNPFWREAQKKTQHLGFYLQTLVAKIFGFGFFLGLPVLGFAFLMIDFEPALFVHNFLCPSTFFSVYLETFWPLYAFQSVYAESKKRPKANIQPTFETLTKGRSGKMRPIRKYGRLSRFGGYIYPEHPVLCRPSPSPGSFKTHRSLPHSRCHAQPFDSLLTRSRYVERRLDFFIFVGSKRTRQGGRGAHLS